MRPGAVVKVFRRQGFCDAVRSAAHVVFELRFAASVSSVWIRLPGSSRARSSCKLGRHAVTPHEILWSGGPPLSVQHGSRRRIADDRDRGGSVHREGSAHRRLGSAPTGSSRSSRPGAWLAQPIALRHPFIFYLGHLPAFAWNHVCAGVLERLPVQRGLRRAVLARHRSRRGRSRRTATTIPRFRTAGPRWPRCSPIAIACAPPSWTPSDAVADAGGRAPDGARRPRLSAW